MHDKQHGALTLVRVLRGSLKKGAKISLARNISEIVEQIYEPLADEYLDVREVKAGNIAVCSGLKSTITGDLMISSINSLNEAKEKLIKTVKSQQSNAESENKINIDEYVHDALRLGIKIPDAVYFCSIEPESLRFQRDFDIALAQLQREDPSLRINYEEATMQTVMGGMGELHLNIVKSRILTEYKLEVELGPLQIAYNETIEEDIRDTIHFKKEISGDSQDVTIEMSLVKDKKELFK